MPRNETIVNQGRYITNSWLVVKKFSPLLEHKFHVLEDFKKNPKKLTDIETVPYLSDGIILLNSALKMQRDLAFALLKKNPKLGEKISYGAKTNAEIIENIQDPKVRAISALRFVPNLLLSALLLPDIKLPPKKSEYFGEFTYDPFDARYYPFNNRQLSFIEEEGLTEPVNKVPNIIVVGLIGLMVKYREHLLPVCYAKTKDRTITEYTNIISGKKEVIKTNHHAVVCKDSGKPNVFDISSSTGAIIQRVN